MTAQISACLAAFAALLWLLRRDRLSLGLPAAYLYSLFLIHLPGALAHSVSGYLQNSNYVEIAMRFTAIASVCFVLGVALARRSVTKIGVYGPADRSRFWWFCLLGGWLLNYGLSPLY